MDWSAAVRGRIVNAFEKTMETELAMRKVTDHTDPYGSMDGVAHPRPTTAERLAADALASQLVPLKYALAGFECGLASPILRNPAAARSALGPDIDLAQLNAVVAGTVLASGEFGSLAVGAEAQRIRADLFRTPHLTEIARLAQHGASVEAMRSPPGCNTLNWRFYERFVSYPAAVPGAPDGIKLSFRRNDL